MSASKLEEVPAERARAFREQQTPADGRVLVTGGASGLGAAVVERIRERGGAPLVMDKDAPRTGELPSWQVDVSDSAAVARAVAEAVAVAGGLDAVVTAAGMDIPGPLDRVPAQAWERVVAVNLLGTAAVVRAALPALRESHGRVVTIASSLALTVAADATAYCASKFGVLGFSRALALETRGAVGVTTVIPGGMRTRFFDGRDEQYRPSEDAGLLPPERVAAAVEFALAQPPGCELRELFIAHESEPTWP